MTITALYCCKNEHEFLELSLLTVLPYVHEVIIFDTGSTDGTVEISKRMASANPIIKVIEHPIDFDHGTEFGCRNIALSHCTKDWVLALDADQLMSDGWLEQVFPIMQDPSAECIGVNYEHLVGSYEHVHKPECGVPPTAWVLFKSTSHMRWRPAAEVCEWAKPEHHASAERSCRAGSLRVCKTATVFHYGFAKRNMMEMAIYRTGRGDHGHSPEQKQQQIQKLQASGNPFLACGPVMLRHNHEYVPSVMQSMAGRYRLELDEGGFIKQRYLSATGEVA